MKKVVLSLALALTLLVSCKKEEGKKRGVDFQVAKQELALTADQEKQYDEVVAKYQKLAEEARAAATANGAKPDRVEMFKKMEERNKMQAEEMAKFLSADQLAKYNDFVAKNGRKRPRYNDELLAKIKTELQLDNSQAAMLEAANDAFEKSYQDAHDFYHGNGELAKEYWLKYDAERKAAMQQVLSAEQFEAFSELVKDQVPHNSEKSERK